MVEVRVPASTANLGPGFDCLGMALSLYNTVHMEYLPNGLEITVIGEGKDEIPLDDTNLVFRAAKAVFDKVQVEPPGLHIVLVNQIPLARGLGSSAAALVGGVVAANALSGNNLSRKELLNLVNFLEGHPDNVGAALFGGVVISVPTETGVEVFPFAPPAVQVVALVPEFHLPTNMVREILPSHVAFQDAVYNIGRACLLVGALSTGRTEFLRTAMQDVLHQPYRRRLIAGMDKALVEATAAGALGVALSGAGPTLIALCRNRDDSNRVGDVMLRVFETEGIKARVFTLAPDTSGAVVI